MRNSNMLSVVLAVAAFAGVPAPRAVLNRAERGPDKTPPRAARMARYRWLDGVPKARRRGRLRGGA